MSAKHALSTSKPSTDNERTESSTDNVKKQQPIDPKPTGTENGRRKPKAISSDYSSDEDNTDSVTTATAETKSSRKLAVTERKDSAPVYRSTKIEKDSTMLRSTSDAILKPTSNGRRRSKPDTITPEAGQKSSVPKTDSRRPNKCVTTKTITLTTTNVVLNSQDMENVIIDIQQAKSSREPTPNRIIPTPVMPGEMIEGQLRYPDTVHEPDDEHLKRRPTITNIPIFEEGTKQFVKCHITEVTDEDHHTGQHIQHDTDRVIETDNCLLSVSDKVSKFSNSSISGSKHVKNVQRRITEEIDEGVVDEDDECLLSVHDKVSKFISTAEDVKRPKSSQAFRKPVDESERFILNEKVVLTSDETDRMTEEIQDECLLSVNDKVTKFLTTADKITKTSPSKPILERPNLEEVDVELRSDDCLLSVSDKVTKFISTAERLSSTAPQKSPELVAKIERQVSRKTKPSETEPEEDTTEIPSREVPERDSPHRRTQQGDTPQRNTPQRDTPQRDTPIQRKTPQRETPQKEMSHRSTLKRDISEEKPTQKPETTASLTTKRDITERYTPQKDKPKSIPTEFSPQVTLRSTEIVKNAKAIFERGASPSSPKLPRSDIMSRPSIWEERRLKETKGEVKLTGKYSFILCVFLLLSYELVT